MKKTTTAVALFTAMTMIASCTKKSTKTTTTPTPTTTGYMTAKINGRSYSTTEDFMTTSNLGSVMVTGSTAPSNETIMLTAGQSPAATGVYTISTSGYTVAAYSISGVSVAAAYGTINFTSISPNWEGTFSFTCIDSTKITEGKFSIKAP